MYLKQSRLEASYFFFTFLGASDLPQRSIDHEENLEYCFQSSSLGCFLPCLQHKRVEQDGRGAISLLVGGNWLQIEDCIRVCAIHGGP